jgi:ATP-dependent Lhr-like helicase
MFLREHADAWTAALTTVAQPFRAASVAGLKACATAVLEVLHAKGALFFHELASACDVDDAELRTAIGELVAAGLVTSDGFAGLRAIVQGPAEAGRHRSQAAGRWSVLPTAGLTAGATGERESRTAQDMRGAPKRDEREREAAIAVQAWTLLRRYGVVFRRLLTREANAAPWRELARVYRRLEARGEIRGGRFVTGMSGEQFALPDAIDRLRETRRSARDGRCLVVSTADPLNLAGIVTSGDRVRAVAANRLVYRDGVPMAVLEGEFMRPLADFTAAAAAEVTTALAGRPMPPVLGGYIGMISR